MTYTKKVLDHGFVTLRNLAGPTRRLEDELDVDTNGAATPRAFDADDIDPAQAARMSFAQMDSARTYTDDMRLNEYLLKNAHTSPFEMIQVWLEVKVPIFIDRQFVRHRVWRRNETSARYVALPAEWYIPKVVGGKAPDKKQGQADNLEETLQAEFRAALDEACARDYARYTAFIAKGVAPEHARMFLHTNHYVHWLGNVDLANLFHFLSLRTHAHAQIEAQAYGFAIVDLLRPHIPGLMALFDKYCKR